MGIQLGFLFPLNYKFVVDNPLSSAQIFEYLPQGVSDGLGLKRDQITMHSLIPLVGRSRERGSCREKERQPELWVIILGEEGKLYYHDAEGHMLLRFASIVQFDLRS